MITANSPYRDTFGVLKLKPEENGEEIAVRPMRAFPLSDPEHFVALLDGDGNEVALIPDLAALPDRPRELLLHELEKSYFLPEVVRVLEITDGPSQAISPSLPRGTSLPSPSSRRRPMSVATRPTEPATRTGSSVVRV